MCAKLVRHMYGTRAAADGWQEEYSTFLVEFLKFEQEVSSPSVFRHPTRNLVMSVHGDDFTTVGSKCDLDWYESQMLAHYELMIQPRLGPGEGDAKEAVILNRIIRWTEHGIEYEADPRQCEKLVAECGMANTNSVATPGLRMSFDQLENDAELPRTSTRPSGGLQPEPTTWRLTDWMSSSRQRRYAVGCPSLPRQHGRR